MEVTKVCILWTYDENDSKDQPIVAFCRAMGDYVWLARVASVFKNIYGANMCKTFWFFLQVKCDQSVNVQLIQVLMLD